MSIRNRWAASAAAAIAVLVAACGAGQPAPAPPAQAVARGAPNAIPPATAAPAGVPFAPSPAAGTARIEAEGLTVHSTDRVAVGPQTNCCGARWSGGTQLWFQASAPGESVDVAFPVARAGTYRVDVAVTGAPDYGIVTLSLDGHAMLTDFDAYAPASVVVSPQNLGTAIPLTAGTHTLTIAVTGRNPASGGVFAGIDYLDLTPA